MQVIVNPRATRFFWNKDGISTGQEKLREGGGSLAIINSKGVPVSSKLAIAAGELTSVLRTVEIEVYGLIIYYYNR